ncbi:cell division inhibitor SulA [Shewanella litorisediminis]|uniref:Cell division protein n=1 Tax=Shewanella litorisediminis TaxID=1173586 RepID=A0ABX7G303_9GAMM|nr:SulA-like leucine-rich domain-containing protein [Shewanella litorisediminis]MCL2917220.1 cell division protein [Shewanella litorisediminis]QRH01694.1 cell division protein [Shewanella litorisediminis]
MNKLIGNAPRHPGLWTDAPAKDVCSTSQVITQSTQSQGRQEILQLAPELARLSLEGRWIVLISPPNIGLKATLAQAGVRMDRVLLVHAKDEVETLWAMEKALTNGTSSAVLCWTNELDPRDKRRLALVAKNAVALGVIFENVNAHLQSRPFAVRPELSHPLRCASSLH